MVRKAPAGHPGAEEGPSLPYRPRLSAAPAPPLSGLTQGLPHLGPCRYIASIRAVINHSPHISEKLPLASQAMGMPKGWIRQIILMDVPVRQSSACMCKCAAHLSCLALPVSSAGHHLDFFPTQHSKELIQTLLPIQFILIPRHLQVDVLEEGPQICRALHGIHTIISHPLISKWDLDA